MNKLKLSDKCRIAKWMDKIKEKIAKGAQVNLKQANNVFMVCGVWSIGV